MHTRILSAAFILLAAAAAFCQSGPAEPGAAGASPTGWWKTIDDKTGQPKSIVHIQKAGDALTGAVEKLFRRPDEEQNPVCLACAGERKDKPIVGMTILWGLRPGKEGWENGSVLDPNNGKIYRCKLTLSPDGQSLTVRGFLGISLLGRSQTWKRVPADAIPNLLR
jgi:uncharacterized protein (DUF2147 family)